MQKKRQSNSTIQNLIRQDVKIYKNGIKESIGNIKAILNELNMDERPPITLYKNILNQSSQQIVVKWLSNQKYCRTRFIQEAFGKVYPQRHIEKSLYMDAMVNILDDLLDEDLDKEMKTAYVIEFLRVFSLFHSGYMSKDIQESLWVYFDKLITLAVSENFCLQKITANNQLDKLIKYSIDLLLCRSRDIDMFVAVALSDFKNKNINNGIKEMARIFRAVNIFKKDILDIKHDKENNLSTVVTVVLSQGQVDFLLYTEKLTYAFSELSDRHMLATQQIYDEDSLAPLLQFNAMIQNEINDILQLAKKIK